MFFSPNFTFDDIESKDMGVILVTRNNDVLMEHSMKYEISPILDSVSNSLESYIHGKEAKHVGTINIEIALVDKVGNPKSWTVKERNRILGWLVKEDYRPFVSEDDNEVIYYLKCTGVKKELNSNLQGIITLTMQPSSHYAFTPVVEYRYSAPIGRDKKIVIDNISNLDELYYPQISIKSLKEDNEITITNNTTKQAFSVKDIEENEELEIDMKLKYVESSTDKNRLADSNRTWIGLKRGRNEILIEGEVEINIKCQFPLLV